MSQSAMYSIATCDGKCQSLHIAPTHFGSISYRFRDVKMFIFYLQNVGQGHGVQFSQLHHSMANVKI